VRGDGVDEASLDEDGDANRLGSTVVGEASCWNNGPRRIGLQKQGE